MWYVRDVLYAVLYVRVNCFVVRGCGVYSIHWACAVVIIAYTPDSWINI